MTLTQNWVGYLDRSYEQIKRSCLARLGSIAPEISDHSESNPLVILLSMFSGIGEMLNLYIDSAARESFLGTARRYSSAVLLTRLIDYNIRACNPSSVNLLFYLVDINGNPYSSTTGDITIPVGTIINSINGNIPFVLLQDVKIYAGSQNAYGSASQYTQINDSIIGSTNGDINQIFNLPNNYVDGSIKVTINNEEWKEYRSFGIMFPTTKGFIVNIDENQQAYIQFGDGVNGAIPNPGMTIFADYKICLGVSGNLPPDQITQIASTINGIPTGVTLKVNNPDYSSGGTNFEVLSDIQNRAPRSIRTLERAVTYQDYKDLCYLVLGVGAAEVSYCCGKYITIYIAPNSAGAATLALLQAVRDYINPRKMITTQISVESSGISKIWIKAVITGKPLILAPDIYNQVVDELDNKYGYSNLQINPKISIAKIIATVEALPTVDNIEISEVKILPFPRPIENTNNPLNIDFLTLPDTTIPYLYTIRWNQNINAFMVYQGTNNMGNFEKGDTYSDNIITFTLLDGTYANSDKWQFTASPSYPKIFPIGTIELKDFSAAIIDVGPKTTDGTPRTIYSDLTIKTQVSTLGTLPSCQ